MSQKRLQQELVVSENADLGAGYFRLQFAVEQGYEQFAAGQFVNIQTAASFDPLLKRPMSIYRSGAGFMSVIGRAVGRGTSLLAAAKAGNRFEVLGPLGLPFVDPPSGARVLLVAGGVGMPPMLAMAEKLLVQKHDGDVLLLYGGRSAADIIERDTIGELGLQSRFSTDDGSLGQHGLVTDLLRAELAKGGKPYVYTCGPEPMMHAVARICEQATVPCVASLENHMACGIGVCLGCVTRVKAANEQGYRYVRTCIEGPGMLAGDLVW